MMKVNIYYGGRGVLDDPTLYVLDKMEEVLVELRVNVDRYNIYEHKSSISTLPQTMKDADGIILATTVEWLGIGGYMQQFLDACWLYGDKEKIARTYMQDRDVHNIRGTGGRAESYECMGDAWRIAVQWAVRLCGGSGELPDEPGLLADHREKGGKFISNDLTEDEKPAHK